VIPALFLINIGFKVRLFPSCKTADQDFEIQTTLSIPLTADLFIRNQINKFESHLKAKIRI